MKFKLYAVSLLIVISGCSSNNFKQIPYGCDSEEADPFCASVESIYNSAVENDERSINVLANDAELEELRSMNSVQSQQTYNRNTPSSGTQDQRLNSIMPRQNINGLEQKPVYIPESVHRVYRGPWRDDANILHSGEHLFYKTPGEWAFGSMKDKGSASGLVTPIAPSELGFERIKEKPLNKKRAGRHEIDDE
jgi:hypothetical protein